MDPRPQQAKLPAGYRLRKVPTLLDGNRWEVRNANDQITVSNQPNPKIAVERALRKISSSTTQKATPQQ